MTATTDIVRRYASARPGYDLVSYREVALPLFQITVEMLVLEKKDIPPIQEFVLRAVDAGLADLPSVSGLLGVDEAVARGATLELLRSDNLVLAGGHAGMHVLQLTNKGAETAKTASHVQAIEVEQAVYVDGLTRKVVSVTEQSLGAFRAGQIPSRGLVEIPAHPRRRPKAEQLNFNEIKAVVARENAGRHARRGSPARREIIGIVGMGKVRSFAREALALAYRSRKDDELVVTLIIDGLPSEAHDDAFTRAQRYSARRLTPEKWTPALEIITGELPDEVIAQAAPDEQVTELESQRDDAQRDLRQLQETVASTPIDQADALRSQLAEAETRERQLLQALQQISVRPVPVYEHREYLDRALEQAERRVLIVSPWIRHEVVDDELVSRFSKLLDRGVELWVGYGISREAKDRKGAKGEADREAEHKLRRLAQRHPNSFHMKLLGNTHAKILLCDSRFSVVTSFNWLSFRGDKHLQFRDERGMYVGIKETVDELFESYRGRFDSTSSHGGRPDAKEQPRQAAVERNGKQQNDGASRFAS